MFKRIVLVFAFFNFCFLQSQVGFNTTGYINIEGGTNSKIYHAVTIQSDGKIVAVGVTDARDGLIARYTAAGTLDTSFNTTGYIKIEGDTDSSKYWDVSIQSDGKIVAVGYTDLANGLIARYTAAGELDTSFNTTGYINTEGGTDSLFYYAVAIQADGKIIAVGIADTAHGLIARYTAAGALDTSFNTIGYINTEGDTDSSSYYAIAIQSDGKIVAVGVTDARDGLIARYTAAGALDTSFNTTGYIKTEGGTDSSSYYAIAIQSDGKIVVVGQTDAGDGLIVRYTAAGVLDTSFNTTGYIKTERGTDSSIYYGVTIQSDDKIVAAGQTDISDGLISRFLCNGVLDATANWTVQNCREHNKCAGFKMGLISAAD